MRFCQLFSNWMRLDIDPFFPNPIDGVPWSGIRRLIALLVQRRKFNQAHTLLRLEADLTGESKRTEFHQQFIAKCEENISLEDEPSLFLIVIAKLYLAERLLKVGDIGQAGTHLSWVIDKLKTPPMTSVTSQDYPCRLLEKVQTAQNQSSSLADIINGHEKVREHARAAKDHLMQIPPLMDIYRVLGDVPPMQRDANWERMYQSNFFRDVESNSNGKASAVFIIQVILRPDELNDSAKASEYLDSLHEFERRFPHFDLPFYNSDLYRIAVRAKITLGMTTELKDFEEKSRIATMNIRNIEATAHGGWQFSANDRANEDVFWQEYRVLPVMQWPEYLLAITISWIKADVERTLLSYTEAAKILCMDPKMFQNHVTSADFLQHVTDLRPIKAAEVLFGIHHPVDSQIWESRFESYSTWLRRDNPFVPVGVRHTILGDIQQARCALVLKYYMEQANDRRNLKNEDLQLDLRLFTAREIAKYLAIVKTLDSRAIGTSQASIFAIEWQTMNSTVILANSSKAYKEGLIHDTDLLEMQLWMQDALERFRHTQITEALATCAVLSSAVNMRYKLFGTVSADACLEYLDRLEQIYTDIRRERSVLKGSDNFIARATIVELWSFMRHYDVAIGACMEALGVGHVRFSYHHLLIGQSTVSAPRNIADNQKLLAEIMKWAQKKKARSVVETLGSEIILPSSLFAALEPTSQGYKLLKRESDLQAIVPLSLGEKLRVRAELSSIRREMRSCLELQPIMDIRDGTSLEQTQIAALSKELGPKCLIVDYVHIPVTHTALPGDILPMVYRDGQLLSSSILGPDLSLEMIQLYVQTFMDETNEEALLLSDEATEALESLNPLVLPVATFSKPGDTIVFCPTQSLHRLPLHALKLGDQILIERNPVVYTQSLTMLSLCNISASSRDASAPLDALLVQALPKHQSQIAPKMSFASHLNTSVLSGNALTKATFQAAAPSASLIHFHGHVGFDESTPLDHHLDIRGLAAERITARDVFGLRLRTGAHVTLIGCGSGKARIGLHDDLLGLSTAFHYAGASSIASTLWSIDNADGAAFAEAFYDEVLAVGDGGNEGEGGVVDLARAMQRAVLSVSVDAEGNRRAPYHWAAFTLHGAWRWKRGVAAAAGRRGEKEEGGDVAEATLTGADVAASDTVEEGYRDWEAG